MGFERGVTNKDEQISEGFKHESLKGFLLYHFMRCEVHSEEYYNLIRQMDNLEAREKVEKR